MKIILLKDIPKLGKKDDIKEMNDGYVRNFLLPGKLVEVATLSTLAKLAERKANRDTEHAFNQARQESTAKALHGLSVEMTVLANEKGNLFKAISAHDIAPLFAKSAGVMIPENVFADIHIKSVGEHPLSVMIGNKKVTCNLIVKTK